jgi:hypothetical protein
MYGRPDQHAARRLVLVAAPLEGAGQPEVHHHGPLVAVVVLDQEDVVALEIPVHDADLVHRRQAGRQLAQDAQRLARRQATVTFDPPCQRLAGEQRHRQERNRLVGRARPLVRAELQDPTDVRVRHLAGDANLGEQPLHGVRLIDRGDDDGLERDRLPQRRIERLVDLAHPAARDETPDLVTAGDRLAVCQRPRRSARRRAGRDARRLGHHDPAGAAPVQVVAHGLQALALEAPIQVRQDVVRRKAAPPVLRIEPGIGRRHASMVALFCPGA